MKRLFSLFIIICLITVCGCDSIKPYTGDNDTKSSSKITIEEPSNDSLDDYISDDSASSSAVSEVSDSNEITDSVSSETATSSYSSEKVTTYYSSSSAVSSVLSEEFDGVYFANTSTKKFHKSTCGSAKLIKDTNLYKTASRDELINSGFSPCLRCNP